MAAGAAMKWMDWLHMIVAIFILASMPTSSHYMMESYGVGSGGTAGSGSANYKVNGIAGEQAGHTSSAHYQAGAGYNYVQQANAPKVALSNPGAWYDKLQLNLDPQANPSDTKFVVAISPDDFATTTDYVQSDFTVGTTLTSGDYLTYAGWGGASGVTLRGLTPTTVYSVKAEAIQGAFTETDWGPVDTVATSTTTPYINFEIDVAPTYTTGTSGPYVLNIGNLLAGTVVTAPDNIWLTVSSNADNGIQLYGGGLYGGLYSAITGHTIGSTSTNLATSAEGWGEQDSSNTVGSGGPLITDSPYNVSGTNVGEDYIDLDEMFHSNVELTNGVGGVSLLAKSQILTPASSDYTETLTMVAAGSF
jgi:hypothetical protein